MARLCLIASILLPVVTINATSAEAAHFPGLGSTLSSWRAVYGRDNCSDNSCFGPATNSYSGGYKFTMVTWGVYALDYVENFSNSTSFASALAQVAITLPSDTTLQSPFINSDGYGGRCIIINGHSKSLRSSIGIELGYVTASGDNSYSLSKANFAYVAEWNISKNAGC